MRPLGWKDHVIVIAVRTDREDVGLPLRGILAALTPDSEPKGEAWVGIWPVEDQREPSLGPLPNLSPEVWAALAQLGVPLERLLPDYERVDFGGARRIQRKDA